MPDGLPGRAVDLPAATVVLKPKRARPFFGRHPWVRDTAILRVEGEPTEGDVVDLTTHDGHFVARGLRKPAGRSRVRLYAFDAATPLDEPLFRRRLESAVKLRAALGLDDPTGGCPAGPQPGEHRRPPAGLQPRQPSGR